MPELRKLRGAAISAGSVALLLTAGCGSSPPTPLPLTPSMEGNGVVRSVDNFVLIGLDMTGDEGGLDGNLDYFFLYEAPSSDEAEHSFPSGIQPLRVELNPSLGQLSLQSGETQMRFHVPRFSENPPQGSLDAKAIYYRNADSQQTLEIGLAERWEEIREGNQVFTASDCQAGGWGAGACKTEACGVISGQGFWACCHQDGQGLCHVVSAASDDNSPNRP